MVSIEDLRSRCCNDNSEITARFPRHCYYYTPPPSSPTVSRSFGGRSMRTIRSRVFQAEQCRSIPETELEPVTDGEVVDVSRCMSDFSACSSDISGEIQRLSSLPDPRSNSESEPELPCSGILNSKSFSTEIIESISPEDIQPTVKLCVDSLQSSSIALKRSAAAKLRQLAKNRADIRALIGESGAVPALIPLLRCSDPTTQEHAVTALLNLSLLETNKSLIITAGAVKSLIHALKTGTDASKQNAACGLLSLASTEKNKLSIGASGAIPPLVTLLKNGSTRGKKDALTTLYKLCSVKLNKERAVTAGAVGVLVGLVGESDTGLAEKAAVVVSILSGTEMGQNAIVEAGGMAMLVEAIENGNEKVKGFAVMTLLDLCGGSVANRVLLVKEGGISPLVALSLQGIGKTKQKVNFTA